MIAIVLENGCFKHVTQEYELDRFVTSCLSREVPRDVATGSIQIFFHTSFFSLQTTCVMQNNADRIGANMLQVCAMIAP
jgi:hypothetical protein